MHLFKGIGIIVILALLLHVGHCQYNSSTGSNSTYPPPINNTNTTNGTNSSYLPPSINNTNTTNGTFPPPINNNTNSTNGTAPPPINNGTNSTNSTNGTANNQTNQTTIPPQNFTTNSTEALSNSGIQVSGNLTIAPPPPITSSIVTTLYNSRADSRFIGSKRAECLRLTQSGGTTSVTFDRFNRSSTTYLDSYSLSLNGLWQFAASSSNELTCSMVYNQASNIYAFLFFNFDSETFSTKASFNTSSLPSPLNSLNLSQMSSAIVGDNCDLLRYGSSIYSISTTAVTKITGTTIVQASSSDLYYAMAGNILYRYSQASISYSQLFVPLTVYSSYKVASYENRVVVWGASSQNVSGRYNVNQTIYILIDNNGAANLLRQYNIVSFQNPGQWVPVQLSPELTKIHFQYMSSSSNSTVSVYFYDINYDESIVSTLTLKNSLSYMNTIRYMPSYSSNNYFLGDYYLVIRNQSAINITTNASSVAGQSTYQFIGDTIIPLRYRQLPQTEITNPCYKTIIDDQELNELMVLNLYYNNDATSPGYNIYQFSYGNLASTIRVIPPTPDAYLTFTYPANTYVSSNPVPVRYQWDFLNVAGGNTNYTSYLQNQQASSHLQIDLFSWTGVWSILASSANCRLVKNSATTYLIHRYTNNGTALSVTTTDVSAALTGGASSWAISSDCSKLKADSSYRAIVSGSLTIVSNSSTIISTDALMTYAVISTGILKYNATANAYSSLYSNANLTLSANAKIYSFSNKIVISDVSSNIAEVYAFVDNAGSVSLVFSYTSTGTANFTASPTVYVSSGVTKILVYGLTSSSFETSFYYIDYTTFSSKELDFPAESVFDRNNVYLALEEDWLYVRQLPSGSQTVPGGNQQIVYSILYDTIVDEADRKNITTEEETNCTKYLLRVLQNGTLYVLTQCNTNPTEPVVNLWQVFPQETSGGNAAEDLGIAQVIIGGQVKLCAPGCKACSTGVCTACNDGYVFDSNSASCYMCPPGCTFCNPSNPSLCTACVEGAFLSGTDCLPCDPSCTTCTGTATSCQSCLPGQYFGGSSCLPCTRNCLSCSSNSSCDACKKGFALTGSGTCRKCSQQCSSCEPNNITRCTSCNVYLQLSGGSCIPCPSRCQRCSGNVCAKCDKGYRPAADGSCVENCVLPCRTCTDSNPSHCLSCYFGSFLNGTTCSLDLSCNLGNNCTDCGQGTGYVLVGANCLRCSNINNCKQCRQTNTRACAICQSGYYINGAQCTICPSICSTCISDRICTSCIAGYTIPNSAAQGQCIACQSPCLTCSGTTTYCTSCVTGYTKKNWLCQNNVNVGFSFTLGTTDVATVLSVIDTIVTFLLNAMRISTDRVDVITFTTIRLGSVTVGGTADPSAGSGSGTSTGTTTSAAAAIAGALTTGASIGSFSVTSSSVVTNGITTTTQESSKLGLIIGLSVGIPIAVITLVIIIYVIYKRNKIQEEEEGQDKQKESMEYIQKGLSKKEEIAIMQLQLAEMGSESKHTNQIEVINKEEDGFSDFIQANPNAIMEPELVSDELENYSPSPIISVNREFEGGEKKQPVSKPAPLTNQIYQHSQIHQPSSIKKIPPPPKAMIEPIIHVKPVQTQQLPPPEEDQFGDFVEEKPARVTPRNDQKVTPTKTGLELVFEDDFGEYQDIGTLAAPVEELQLPDEDEFGAFPEDNPSKLGLMSYTEAVPSKAEEKISVPSMKQSILAPQMFQLQLDGESQSQYSKKEDETKKLDNKLEEQMESQGSRY